MLPAKAIGSFLEDKVGVKKTRKVGSLFETKSNCNKLKNEKQL